MKLLHFLIEFKSKCNKIDDGRRNLSSIGNAVKKLYDNIESLFSTVLLRNVYESEGELPAQVKRVGLDF